ncbi:MAG: hypothetical protein Q8O26_01225 [Phreatobacter sp.]|uniref:hypothetical protein n=1 Tax=Phreatobacter sp. TaxID=1966341 RepID=UPI0027376134|nr:hypothetical protein [Phreatobacter sp.]MDP2800481.1 hypothetical protein [Phreatobacter sp.]
MAVGFLVVLLIVLLVFGGYFGGARGAGGSVITLMAILTGLHLIGWLPDPWW